MVVFFVWPPSRPRAGGDGPQSGSRCLRGAARTNDLEADEARCGRWRNWILVTQAPTSSGCRSATTSFSATALARRVAAARMPARPPISAVSTTPDAAKKVGMRKFDGPVLSTRLRGIPFASEGRR